MGPNRRAQERERAAARAAAEAKRPERKAIAEAEKIVAIWNARQAGGRALWFYPTIGAALVAKRHYRSRRARQYHVEHVF